MFENYCVAIFPYLDRKPCRRKPSKALAKQHRNKQQNLNYDLKAVHKHVEALNIAR